MRRATAIVAGCVVLSTGIAWAQSHPSTGVFVQGGAFASIERRPHSEVEPGAIPLVFLSDPGGTVAGGTFGIGAFLRPYLTARAEVALPGTIDEQADDVIPGLSGSSEASVRARDVYVLLGFETDPGRRVRVSYLAGAVIRQQRVHRVTTLVSPGLPPLIPTRVERLEDTSLSYGTSLAVGLDAAIAVTPRMAVVPHVRVAVIGGGLSVRPGAALRWNF